jgi:hypothetical protein
MRFSTARSRRDKISQELGFLFVKIENVLVEFLLRKLFLLRQLVSGNKGQIGDANRVLKEWVLPELLGIEIL